jgi:cobalamin biosynthetic protein CobC
MTGFTFHGGRLSEAEARFGSGTAPWIDLSTGINPHTWPGTAAVPIDWSALPDPTALAALESAAAACFGVAPSHICAVPGTEIGLRMLGDMIGGPAAYATPSYRTHAAMFRSARAVPSHEIADVVDATVLIANPNNPDGRVTPAATLLDRLAGSASPRWLVIDEAFADAEPGISLADHVDDGRRLVIFRSFGKFFGLAGVRLGFVLGPRAIVDAYRDRLGSWPVSAAALAIGTAAYRDIDWIGAMRVRLRAEAATLDALLPRHGYRPIGTCPLFRLIDTDDAAGLFARLARHAILTRPFDETARWLRIGLPPDAAALDRLDRALADG